MSGARDLTKFFDRDQEESEKQVNRKLREINTEYCVECIRSVERIIANSIMPRKVIISEELKSSVISAKDRANLVYDIGQEAFDRIAKEEFELRIHYAAAELIWVEAEFLKLKETYDKFTKYSKSVLKI